jgi:hypothetical protein
VSGQVGSVVEKVALGRVFSEYFGFPCQSSFNQILHHHNHPGQATIGQSVAAVPSGPSWTPLITKRIKKEIKVYWNAKSSVVVGFNFGFSFILLRNVVDRGSLNPSEGVIGLVFSCFDSTCLCWCP